MGQDRWTLQRQEMVEHQIAGRGVLDQRVLDAMREIPRDLFVPPEYRDSSYQDRPLPIGNGQTISQPYIVAVMTELLETGPSDTILEVGTGSGYQAAILAKLAARVVTIERLPEIAAKAGAVLMSLGISNVKIIVGDGTEGYAPDAPYNGIIITAASPGIPQSLIGQLAEGGRLVAPVGPRDLQQLVRLTKKSGRVIQEDFGGVVFVPLLGRYGWQVD